MKRLTAATFLILVASALTSAQQSRPLSPAGTATALVGGEWVKDESGAPLYRGGKWIEVSYSRPMLRQRTNIFGVGANYGVAVRAGATLWRAGANQTTVLKTEVALVFGSTTVPAGEYGVLIDLRSPSQWTLVLTSQPRQAEGAASNNTDLIGAVNYNPKFDVARVPMQVDSKAASKLDQLTIFFSDVTRTGGKLAIAWENTVATTEFTLR
jgi:Protein of unknown function (DUF2911)